MAGAGVVVSLLLKRGRVGFFILLGNRIAYNALCADPLVVKQRRRIDGILCSDRTK